MNPTSSRNLRYRVEQPPMDSSKVDPADIALIQQWWEKLMTAGEDPEEPTSTASPLSSPPPTLSPESLNPTPTVPFSRFELLPGEIRNEIYAYLLSPSLNTSHDVYTYQLDPARNANNNNASSAAPSSSSSLTQAYPSDIYAYRDLTPAKVVSESPFSDSESDDEDEQLVIYSKGNAMATMRRIRIYHEILLTNKRIYKEAHRYLYTVCGPVLKVRGIPYTSSLCRLMGRLGFRWFYTRPTELSIPGSIGSLKATWKEIGRNKYSAKPNQKFAQGPRDPDIVLLGSQIQSFVQWLQILKMKDIEQNQFFKLAFTLQRPKNIYQEEITSHATMSRFQNTLLESFKSFTGMGIRYKFLPGDFNPPEVSEYLKFYNQPIMWIRAETLRIVSLIQSISKQGLDPQYKRRDLVDDLCKWVFIGDLVRNKVSKSYPQPADFRPRTDDLYPILALYQIFHISFYNVAKCLFLMVVRGIVPKELGVEEELDTLKELCYNLDEIASQTLEVETSLGIKDMCALKPDHIASVHHLQAMICFYCHEIGMASKGIEYFQKCIKFSEGERKRDFEFLADAAETWRNDGRVTGDLMYLLLQRFPEADLEIELPEKMESSRLEHEWKMLQKYGYIGDPLTDRFEPVPGYNDGDNPNLNHFPDSLYLEDYKASKFAKKVWFGTGTDELFISDPLDD